jgi:hypothetical protein
MLGRNTMAETNVTVITTRARSLAFIALTDGIADLLRIYWQPNIRKKNHSLCCCRPLAGLVPFSSANYDALFKGNPTLSGRSNLSGSQMISFVGKTLANISGSFDKVPNYQNSNFYALNATSWSIASRTDRISPNSFGPGLEYITYRTVRSSTYDPNNSGAR